MSKQEQIDEGKKSWETAILSRDSWRQKAKDLEGAEALRTFNEGLAAKAKAKADLLAAENATIRQIENGLIPVDALRAAWHATHSGGDQITVEFLFRPDAGQDRIRAAVLKALTEPARPKFATGGYTGSAGYIPTDLVHPCEYHFHGLTQLSPADRKLLLDIANGLSMDIS